MPTAEQLRSRLLRKLKELFQLDQPDLDFGFYRIMHAKAQQVKEFIDKDLLKIVADAFGQVDETRNNELHATYEKALQTAREFGAPNPEETEPVKKAKAALDTIKDTASAEADVYDHLYRFFERYYDDGDFISRRYFTRETSGKAAPFAVPYNGEEVKLHWANADQYYIKTAEYFSNFTFDLRKAKEIHGSGELNELQVLLQDPNESPLKVHFRVVDATEGEHGNVKASENNKRFFIIYKEKPVLISEDSELVVNFEYRADPEKTGQENSWRDKRNVEATQTILTTLDSLVQTDKTHTKLLEEYLRLLKVAAPTEKDKQRPVLAKYINQYTARNTMDYFIHKDLGDFLRRELDFYIKNEVMRLDDIEDASAPAVESYLSKIRVLRNIAGKLIGFLAQLEDFQKKLWLKKKFVVETNYCITLDRVPKELYPEIAANEAQHDEWVKLFAINEIERDLENPGYTKPLKSEFLKANNKLALDTRFFGEEFKAKLFASIENFDEQCDGLLIHSENLQALNLLQERYREQIKCVYIDPPYNTGGDGFTYKDSYQHSSWISMLIDRLYGILPFASNAAVFFASIDDNEVANMRSSLDRVFGTNSFESQIIVQSNKRGQTYQSIAKTHEYLMAYNVGPSAEFFELHKDIPENSLKDASGTYELWELRNRNPKFGKHNRPNLYYPIYVSINDCNEDGYAKVSLNKTSDFCFEVFPKNSTNGDSCWRWGKDKVRESISNGTFDILVAKQKRDGGWNIYEKARKGSTKAKSLWSETEVINEQGTVEVGALGFTSFGFPKPLGLLRKVLLIGATDDGLVIDYFAGSGTTGHAVINLNREDEGKRKYILVEMGDYFDTVLKPRIAKVVYSQDWKDGKPTARHTGISHCFKYLRLESYEDTLNNLRFDEKPASSALLKNPSLKEDYMLRYLLDVETRGSQSLLNIDAFADPAAYKLNVKKPGSDEIVTRNVDLLETFNYLIGLRVLHIGAPQSFSAAFKRIKDKELPDDQNTKLVVDGKVKQDDRGPWWFRKIEGWVPKDPMNPNNGQREKVLIVWRKLAGNLEQDNLMLDEWFQKNRISTRDFEFDTIYVNGSNNLPNLLLEGDTWKVRLIEEEFMKRMWEVQ